MLQSKKIMYPIAYLLFPIVNIALASYTNLITENYSYVGNDLQHSYLFYIWGILCGIYFYITTKTVIKKMGYTMKYGIPILRASCLGMMLSVFIPYLPSTFPMIGEIHIYISILATVSYVLLFFHILLEFVYKRYDLYKIYYPLYATMVGFCLLTMILFGGVNSIMEFTFSCGQAILLTNLVTQLYQETTCE